MSPVAARLLGYVEKEKTAFLENRKYTTHLPDASPFHGKSRSDRRKGKAFCTKGSPQTGKWPHWKMRPVSSVNATIAFGSMRYPGHYLDASIIMKGQAKVYVAAGNPNEFWAQWSHAPHENNRIFSWICCH
jgi:hypothetical protein